MELKERSGTLYVFYYEDGKLCRKSLKLKATKPNKAYAEKFILPELLQQKLKGARLFEDTKISVFLDLVLLKTERKKYQTLVNYRRGVKYFLDYFGDRDVKSFRVADLDEYAKFLSPNRAPSTVITYLAPIGLAFKEAIRRDCILKNPVSYCDKPERKRRERSPLTLTQVRSMLDNSSGHLRLFLYFGFFSGMRIGEVIALRWENVDFERKRISIDKTRTRYGLNTTKTGKSRVIPLVPILYEFLSSVRKDEGVIIPVSYVYLSRLYKELFAKLGYKYETPHITRHTFTSLMLQARENVTLVQRFLGHVDLSMISKVYGHYLEDDGDCNSFNTLLTQQLA